MKKHFSSALIGLAFIVGLSFSRQVPTQVVGLTPEQQEILSLFSIEQLDDCAGGPGYKTLRVTGANLQIVNGLGITDSTNGVGNLIVGYNENFGLCDRIGSHNTILGINNSYTQWAGITTGINNQLLGTYNVVFGIFNTANNESSNVFNGIFNTSSDKHSTVIGGATNNASGENSVVVGGEFNQATQRDSVTVGGQNNINSGDKSVLVGGRLNAVSGTKAVLSGGFQRSATGEHDWVSGSLLEDN